MPDYIEASAKAFGTGSGFGGGISEAEREGSMGKVSPPEISPKSSHCVLCLACF